jgi:hypothetical protein
MWLFLWPQQSCNFLWCLMHTVAHHYKTCLLFLFCWCVKLAASSKRHAMTHWKQLLITLKTSTAHNPNKQQLVINTRIPCAAFSQTKISKLQQNTATGIWNWGAAFSQAKTFNEIQQLAYKTNDQHSPSLKHLMQCQQCTAAGIRNWGPAFSQTKHPSNWHLKLKE